MVGASHVLEEGNWVRWVLSEPNGSMLRPLIWPFPWVQCACSSASIHCYLDPSSGASLCTRELFKLLAARTMDCRVLATGVLDPERETIFDEVPATLALPLQRFGAGHGQSGRGDRPERERRTGDAHADSLKSRRVFAQPRAMKGGSHRADTDGQSR